MKKIKFSILVSLLLMSASAFSLTGTGTAINPYKIGTAQDLIDFKNAANYTASFGELTANIDLTGYAWTPIGGFYGEFDGKNFKISNITLGSLSTPIVDNVYGALFVYIFGATVKNVVLNNINIFYSAPNSSWCGILAGQVLINGAVKPLIDNCHITNSSITVVSAPQAVCLGPICGYIASGAIKNCSAKVTTDVTSENTTSMPYLIHNIGGLVGQMATDATLKVVNSYSVGSITAKSTTNTYYFVGGAVGVLSAGSIENVYSSTSVTVGPSAGPMLVGGIVGNSTSNINNCIALNTLIKGYTGGPWLLVKRISGSNTVATFTGPNYAANDLLYYAMQANTDGSPWVAPTGTTTNGDGLNLGSNTALSMLNGYVANNSGLGYKTWEVVTGVNNNNPVFVGQSLTTATKTNQYNNQLKAVSQNSIIKVSGLKSGELVVVFNTVGSIVWKGVSTSTELELQLPKGIYGISGINKLIINK